MRGSAICPSTSSRIVVSRALGPAARSSRTMDLGRRRSSPRRVLSQTRAEDAPGRRTAHQPYAPPQALPLLPLPVRARSARLYAAVGVPQDELPGGEKTRDATTLPRCPPGRRFGAAAARGARGGQGGRSGQAAARPAGRGRAVPVGRAARRDIAASSCHRRLFRPIGRRGCARRDPRPSPRPARRNRRIGPRRPERRDGGAGGAWINRGP